MKGVIQMKKIDMSRNKTLKLNNVLKIKLDLEDEDAEFNMIVEKMQSYIKVKGAMQIGPLIQHTKTFTNEEEELDMEINMLLQCNNYIH